jgi:hypothetical protein
VTHVSHRAPITGSRTVEEDRTDLDIAVALSRAEITQNCPATSWLLLKITVRLTLIPDWLTS